jgi:hypothetical protein
MTVCPAQATALTTPITIAAARASKPADGIEGSTNGVSTHGHEGTDQGHTTACCLNNAVGDTGRLADLPAVQGSWLASGAARTAGFPEAIVSQPV